MMLLLASTAVKKSLGTESDEVDANPLKSLSNPAKAIAFLFDPATRTADGPDPVQALGDACSDLRVHQIALMSAMQAAVLTALQRVDPKAIEREHGSSLGGLTLNKKSKLWDLAVAHHEQLTLEVGESINRVFGAEVQAAYAAEVRRIRGGR
jgi:predicted component of type VI protein secretion system